MQADEFNAKYARILSAFSLLRVYRALRVKWGIQGSTYIHESCQLFLYLRTLMRYVPGINITDKEIDCLFKNALTLVSSLNFLEYEPVLQFGSNYMVDCDCTGAAPVIIIQEGSGSGTSKPSPFSIFYSNGNWNAGHTIYTEPTWAGLTFKVMSNTDNRFLNDSDGFQVLVSGGFSITNPMYDGQEFIPIF